jgi:NAD(P)H dehydrogenase (quinone)
MSDRSLLVTGASGQLGRRVVELLLAQRAGRVIAGTRDPEKVADLAAKGAEVRRVDFDDVASLDAAFAGVDRLLIVSTDAVDRPGRRLEQHLRAIGAADRAGVGHVVYTSLTRPEPGSPVTIAPDHWGTEQAIGALRAGSTILRDNLYADYLPYTLPQAAASGQLHTARGDGRIAFVLREDCARAAAAALADDVDGRRVIDVTGPDALSGEDLARIASELGGKRVVHVPVTADALRAGMIGAGMPAGVADLMVSFDLAAARGDLGHVSDGVDRLTGRPPTSVAAFLRSAWPR